MSDTKELPQTIVRTEQLDYLAVRLVDVLAQNGVIQRKTTSAGMTLRQLFERYIDIYAKPHLATWRDMERSFKNYFDRFAEKDLYQIARADVQAWHAEIGELNGQTIANRALELLVMLYNKAQEWDLIALYNPGSKIRKFKRQPRERFLQHEELPRFFAALETLRYEVTKDLFLMLLFTGARVGNVREMRWEQVDFSLRIWRIPKTKNGDSQIVPLTMEAMSILKNRKRNNVTPWVFVNKAGTDHIRSHDMAWRALCKKAEISNLRIHDLRRSMASWQAITGANISLIAATLNHKDLSSTAIYARLNTDAIRGAMKGATQAILEHAGVIGEAEPLRELPAAAAIPLSNEPKGEPWLSEKEISTRLGISTNILALARSKNNGPAYLKRGYRVFYKASAVSQWWLVYKPQKGGRPRRKISPGD